MQDLPIPRNGNHPNRENSFLEKIKQNCECFRLHYAEGKLYEDHSRLKDVHPILREEH